MAAVGFQYRFHPGIQAAREIIQSGKLGEIVCAAASWGNICPAGTPGRITAGVMLPGKIWVAGWYELCVTHWIT